MTGTIKTNALWTTAPSSVSEVTDEIASVEPFETKWRAYKTRRSVGGGSPTMQSTLPSSSRERFRGPPRLPAPPDGGRSPSAPFPAVCCSSHSIDGGLDAFQNACPSGWCNKAHAEMGLGKSGGLASDRFYRMHEELRTRTKKVSGNLSVLKPSDNAGSPNNEQSFRKAA